MVLRLVFMFFYVPIAIDFSQGFWYSTLLGSFTLEGAKLLAASTELLAALTSAVEWYKSHTHILFLSKLSNFHVPTQLIRVHMSLFRGEQKRAIKALKKK